jgi:hypothetical protein
VAGECEKVASVPHSEFRPSGGFSGPSPLNGDHHTDQRHLGLRRRLEAVRERSGRASCWHSLGSYLGRLINRDGHVPVRVRLSRADIAFLTNARANLLAFAELGLRLIDLHRPRDAGGISSDPASPIRRCHACMWRWPCPTFRLLDEAMTQPGSPGVPELPGLPGY